MKERKILIVTLGYIIGIIWGLYCKCNIAFLYFLISISIAIIIKTRKSKHKFKILSFSRNLKYLRIIINYNTIVIIFISSLISNFITNRLNYKYDNLYKDIQSLEIVAKVISNEENVGNISKYIIQIKECKNESKLKNTKLIINVRSVNIIKFGDILYIKGDFIEPEKQRNYGGFNYKQYLKTRNIYGTLKVKSFKKIGEVNNVNIFNISNNIFLKIKDNIKKTYSKKQANIMLGIMLGYTKEIDDNTKENFKTSSISHALAISGMHIMYIVLGISIVLSKGFGKRNTKIITIFVLILYMFVTNFSPSVVRAGIMGIITLLSSLLYRKKDIITTISISLLIILLYNPFLIMSSSVILSYGGTLGIIIFSESILDILKKIRVNSKRIKYKINKNLIKLDLEIKKIIAITISVQIIIMPIMIKFYNTISISVIITNLFLSFIIGVLIILGFLQILISFFSINIAKIFSVIINILINILLNISKLGNILPFSKIYVCTPCNTTIILYYTLIILVNYLYTIINKKDKTLFQNRVKNMYYLCKYLMYQNKKRILKIIVSFTLVFIIFICIPKSFKLYFIDVGQGDSTLINTAMNKTILIDGGGSLSDTFDVGESTLLPYLLDRKVNKIDYMIISHFDQDHVRPVYLLL